MKPISDTAITVTVTDTAQTFAQLLAAVDAANVLLPEASKVRIALEGDVRIQLDGNDATAASENYSGGIAYEFSIDEIQGASFIRDGSSDVTVQTLQYKN